MKKNHPTKLLLFPVWFIVFLLVTGCDNPPQWVADPASYVDPFIGTAGEGFYRRAANTVPGAVVPFGMLNFSPEHAFTEEMLTQGRVKRVASEGLRMPVSPGGYNYAATRIKGFSLTRLSGTGCLGASGDIPILPFTGEIKHSPDNDPMDRYYSVGFSHDREQAKPGYYRVKMDNGIQVELTATDRSGFARFTYPPGKPALLLVRTSYSQLGSGDAFTMVDVQKGEITGYVTSGNFCGYLGPYNRRDYYTLYFVVQLDQSIKESGGWIDEKLIPGVTESRGGMPYGEGGIPKNGKGSGLWVELDNAAGNTVNMRVGISYVSLENARLNLAREQNHRDTIETISRRGYRKWQEALSRIQVESTDADLLKTFYTALYHCQFHPNVFSDANGEYAGFDGQIHRVRSPQKAQYANFSGWDVYRSQLQLIALIHPDRANDIAQSLLNQADQYNGIWDRWTHNNGPTGVMCGDPATIAIANFVAFGCTGFDVAKAYRSLAKAAKVPTPFDLSDVGRPIFTRGQKPSLDQWLKLNYISDSSNAWEGASETLEQASAYFALSQLAERLQFSKDHHLFLRQSGFWKNLFNPKAVPDGGYLQGRYLDGTWKRPFDPTSTRLFVEGSPAQYLWMVPFDGNGLFEKLGGAESASKRLDKHFHKPDGSWALYRAGGAYANMANQPSISTPWMYHFAGQAYKTQETVRAVLSQLWKPSPDGIPGQDDLGQMSSWYVFSSLGMYPLYPGRADMVLGSPVFTRARIIRPDRNIVIQAIAASPGNIYVQSLRVNGKGSLNAWVPEDFINNGGELRFVMSSKPNIAFGGPANRPPSYPAEKKDTPRVRSD